MGQKTKTPGYVLAMALNAKLDQRYAEIVSAKLGVTVVHLRNDEFVAPNGRKTGATIPVFGMPAEFVEQAQCLGLRAEAVR